MYLYDKKENKLDVYEFSANNADLETYRAEKIEQIPKKERFFLAKAKVDPYGEAPLFEKYLSNSFNDEIVFSHYVADNEENEEKQRFHVLQHDGMNFKDNNVLLTRYILGYLEDRIVVQIKYLEKIKYFLLNKDYKYALEYYGGKHYVMEGIIQLPESLYLLQLLEQERFALLKGKNISEQLALYNFDKINEVSIEEIKKMDACGITNNACSQIINKATNDEHILKLLKK